MIRRGWTGEPPRQAPAAMRRIDRDRERRPQRFEALSDRTDHLGLGQIAPILPSRHRVDRDHPTNAGLVPELGVVLDRFVSDRDHAVAPRDQFVARLVAEQADASSEPPSGLLADPRPGTLEGRDVGDAGLLDERRDGGRMPRVACLHAEQQRGSPARVDDRRGGGDRGGASGSIRKRTTELERRIARVVGKPDIPRQRDEGRAGPPALRGEDSLADDLAQLLRRADLAAVLGDRPHERDRIERLVGRLHALL